MPSAPIRNIEEFFLKIFKVVVLIVMGLALVTVVIGLLVALQQFSQKPRPPEPAKKAPATEINLDDFKRSLPKAPDAAQKQPPGGAEAPSPIASLDYLEDVTRLYRCTVDFARKVQARIEETDNAATAERVESLRADIEREARAEHRGEAWVKSLVPFTCAALADPEIVELRKSGKHERMVSLVLNFHVRAWDKREDERTAFEAAERARVEEEIEAENLRVAMAMHNATLALGGAGGAFALFMMLALYLVFAKIEINLREISVAMPARERDLPPPL